MMSVSQVGSVPVPPDAGPTPAGAPVWCRMSEYATPYAVGRAPGSPPGAACPAAAAAVSPANPDGPGAANPVSMPPRTSPSTVPVVTRWPGRTRMLKMSSATYTDRPFNGPAVIRSVIHVPGYGAPTAPDHACPAAVITPGPSG